MTEFMIDIETLGQKPGAPIVQIGVCWFELAGNGPAGKMQLFIDPESCLDHGLQPEWQTIQWWSQQDPAARDMVFRRRDDAAKLPDALELLGRWVKGKGGLWANSPSFDMVLLEAAYRACDMKVPWQFWRFRDQRTIVSLAGIDKKTVPKPENFIEHHAMSDATWQVLIVQAAYRRLLRALDAE